MAIIWAGEAVGEALATPAGQYTAQEIAAILTALSWTISAGIAYWFGPGAPYQPPTLGFCWAGGGGDGKDEVH